MIRLSIATVIAIALALWIAGQLGGNLGNGVVVGAGMGSALCILGALHMAHTLRTQPSLALTSFSVAFMLKLLLLVMGTLAFRFVPQAAEHVDHKGFMLAYAGLVALLVPIGSFDALRDLRKQLNNSKLPVPDSKLPVQGESGL